MLLVYPLFLAHALPQPFLKFLRGRIAVPVLAVIATVIWAADFVTEFWIFAAALALMFAAALALHAVFVALTNLARRRAILFTVAFGIRDVVWGVVYASGVFGFLRGTELEDLVRNQFYAGSTLLYIPIVAYGSLRLSSQ